VVAGEFFSNRQKPWAMARIWAQLWGVCARKGGGCLGPLLRFTILFVEPRA